MTDALEKLIDAAQDALLAGMTTVPCMVRAPESAAHAPESVEVDEEAA
jgi:hypothetical protein